MMMLFFLLCSPKCMVGASEKEVLFVFSSGVGALDINLRERYADWQIISHDDKYVSQFGLGPAPMPTSIYFDI